MLAAKDVRDRGGKQRIDVAPGKEHQTRNCDEPEWMSNHECQDRNRDRFHYKHDRHRVVASDAIRYPTKERPRRTIQNLIQGRRQGQNRVATEQRILVIAVRHANWFQLSRQHQTAGRDQRHHQVKQVKRSAAQHFPRRVITR